MKNKTILLISFLIASGSALAEQTLLEGATKELAKDAATSAAPEAIKGAETASQALEGAKTLKESVTNAPAALKEQAQERATEAVKPKLNEAKREQLRKKFEALKSNKKTFEELKSKVENAPDVIKEQAQESATEAVKQKIEEATPEQAQQGLEALKNGKETVEGLKGGLENAPKSASEATEAVKGKATEKAFEKTQEMLH